MKEFDEEYDEAMDKINEELENYTGEGSGWQLEDIESVFLQISRYKPIRGGTHIPTPEFLKGKYAIVNMQNFHDNLCFIYCILAFLYPATDNPQRVNHYKKHLHKLKYEGIKMPMAVKDIEKFEKMNNLIINVYACERGGSEIWLRRISKKRGKAINLLMIEDDGRYHYTLINDLNILLKSPADGGSTREFCPFCLHGFVKRYLKPGQMKNHMEECFKKRGLRWLCLKRIRMIKLCLLIIANN